MCVFISKSQARLKHTHRLAHSNASCRNWTENLVLLISFDISPLFNGKQKDWGLNIFRQQPASLLKIANFRNCKTHQVGRCGTTHLTQYEGSSIRSAALVTSRLEICLIGDFLVGRTLCTMCLQFASSTAFHLDSQLLTTCLFSELSLLFSQSGGLGVMRLTFYLANVKCKMKREKEGLQE